MSESRIKQMNQMAQVFEPVLSFNLRQSAILPMEELSSSAAIHVAIEWNESNIKICCRSITHARI